MSAANESLLDSYLRFSTAINNGRVVSELPFNEALICNLLYRSAPQAMTATDLCEQTRMQKSQMARTLNEMEEKELILRTRSTEDRRQVLVALNQAQAGRFFRQHEQTLTIAQAISDKLTPEKAQLLAKLLNEAADAAREILG